MGRSFTGPLYSNHTFPLGRLKIHCSPWITSPLFFSSSFNLQKHPGVQKKKGCKLSPPDWSFRSMPQIFSGHRDQTRVCLEVASVMILTHAHIIQL